MKIIKIMVVALAAGAASGSVALADGYKDCTKLDKASWKTVADAEAKAKSEGYEVRQTKIEGTCYEVYGVKGGKLYELFYSPEDLALKHTKAK
ncbi:hypothetical protein ACVIJ6_001002 [Bradyrhizobium sp. USDA 4369]